MATKPDYRKLTVELRKAWEEGDERGTRVRPADLGLPMGRWGKFERADDDDGPERLNAILQSVDDDVVLLDVFGYLRRAESRSYAAGEPDAKRGDPPETFRLGWEVFAHFASAILAWARNEEPPMFTCAESGDWRAEAKRIVGAAAGDVSLDEMLEDLGPVSPEGEEMPKRAQGKRGHVKRPCEDAFTVWRLRDLTGETQDELAETMQQETHKPFDQPKVSRYLSQVKAYLKAGNILPDLSPERARKPISVDPARLDMGRRRDTGRRSEDENEP